MHVAIITAGGAGMFCGSCMHDNTWARALLAAGADVSLIPTYTPIRVDEADVSLSHVFFGGLNVYFASKWRWWNAVPRVFKQWLDHPGVIRFATKLAVSNNARELGTLTLDMLAGEAGPQAEQVEELACFIAEQIRPDIVVFSNALLAGAVRRIKELFPGPVLCVLQGDDIFLNSLPESDHPKVMEALRNRVRDFDRFITHSRYYAEFMASLFFPDVQERESIAKRFHVLPLGIDLRGHDGTPRAANDPFTIGYFARLCPEKGLHHLVDAFSRLHLRQPRTRLCIGGYLGERDQRFVEHVRAQAARLGPAVQFVGSPATHFEKVQFLKSLDVLSVPTVYHEPKGLSILEALANGVPVVQPAHGSFPELLEATQGGLLFAPGNLDELATQWERLLKQPDERLRLGTLGQQNVRDKFSAAVLADQTLDLFRSLTRTT